MTDGAGLFETGVYRRAARAALDSVTTERPRSVEALARGNRKRTAVVRFDDHPPVVLQVCTEQRWLRTESVLLGRIRGRTSVPVPPVLAAGTTGGVAFMITAYVPGDDLHERFAGLDSARQQALSREFGRYLGRLHGEFRFGGYGTIAVDDGQLVAQSDDWRRWFTEYGRAAIARLPSEFDPVRGGLQGLFAGQSRRRPPTPRLFPWDFRPGNALFADGQITAILDWEAPLAAAPALAAAKAEYLVARWYSDDPETLRAAFVAGYEQVRPYPEVQPAHRAAAIADSAVDSNGVVTNPDYPELDRERAIRFHREALDRLL